MDEVTLDLAMAKYITGQTHLSVKKQLQLLPLNDLHRGLL